MIDMLKIVEILEKEMDEPKARAVARAIDDAARQSGDEVFGRMEKTFVTKDDFYTAMRDMQKQLSELQKQLAELESRLLRWTFGFWVTAIAAIVAARWMR